MLLVNIGIASNRGNSNVYQQHMLLKIRKLNLNLHLNPVSCPIVFASFKHLKQPISIIIPVTIPQIVSIWMTAIYPNLI